MFESVERQYLKQARVARLATADANGRPHVVPICFVLDAGHILSPLDEKPKTVEPSALRRVQDILENDTVALVADHYTETWAALGWVQVRGTAEVIKPGDNYHTRAIGSLRDKYDQYADHELEQRPMLQINPGSVKSWGELDPPESA